MFTPVRFRFSDWFAPKLGLICLAAVLCLASSAAKGGELTEAEALARLRTFDVVWNQPGKSSLDSMPLGNGDVALNVWVEEGGDILFYVAKNDAWGEAVASPEGLLKLARMRLSMTPKPWGGAARFEQRLNLREGAIELRGGEKGSEMRVRIWVDAHAPVVRVETEGDRPVTLTAKLEPLRTEESLGAKSPWVQSRLHPDTVIKRDGNEVVWYYANGNSKVPALKDLKFGGRMEGRGFTKIDELTLQSGAAPKQTLQIVAAAAQVETEAAWTDLLAKTAKDAGSTEVWGEHTRWWREFWGRSWIFVEGDEAATEVTRGYILQRFMMACSSRGRFPAKFNGALFTMDMTIKGRDKEKQPIRYDVDGDYRTWGGQYWFQNTRLLYWPLLASGDFDLLAPFFQMYRGILETNAPLVKGYYGFEGSIFEETTLPHGGLRKMPPEGAGRYTNHYWTGGLEFLMMGLEYYRITGDRDFANRSLIPSARWITAYFSNYFRRDAQGKLLLEPLNSLETYWKVKNPSPDVAGMQAVLTGLLELSPSLLSDSDRQAWNQLLKELPPLPLGEVDGARVILAAEDLKGEASRNSENPELYPVFPFFLYGLQKPDLELARQTFEHRKFKGSGCWVQDPIQAALLGFTDVARDGIVTMSRGKLPECRFPAFWGPGHDYTPDMDHGGVLQMALQQMVMQTAGEKIKLLPAWPKNWKVWFKLHAPGQTVINGFADGTGRGVSVAPASRKEDVRFATEN